MNFLRILIILFFTTYLYSNVQIKGPSTFVANEPYIFTLVINESDIDPLDIKTIDSFEVTKGRTSSSYSNINGNVTREILTQYILYPTRTFTIPSYTFKKDDKVFKTQKIKITKRKINKTESTDFDFTISTNKKTAYVGEEILLKIVFKYKKNIQLVDLGFQNPTFENFWFKQLDNSKKYEEGEFVIQEIFFLLFPQKSTDLTISALRVDASLIEQSSNVYSFLRTNTISKKIYSNSLNIKAKALPPGISLIGDFNIEATVNKTEVTYGESISYKVKVSGYGNIDDLKEQKLEIEDSTIYENKAIKKSMIKDGKYYGEYNKTFSILASKDFTIKPVELKYFDINTKSIKIIKTKPFNVKVINKKKLVSTLEKKDDVQRVEKIVEKVVIKSSVEDKVLYFSLGLIFALLIFGLIKYGINFTRVKEEVPLLKTIKKSKNKNELLKILTPYVLKNESLDKLIFALEDKNVDFKGIKKDIINIIKVM